MMFLGLRGQLDLPQFGLSLQSLHNSNTNKVSCSHVNVTDNSLALEHILNVEKPACTLLIPSLFSYLLVSFALHLAL